MLSDAAPMYAGKPGRFKKRPLSSSGSHSGYMEDWHKVVKNLVVSSKEAQASRLVDGTGGYWQSSGAQGKVSRLLLAFIKDHFTSQILCRTYSRLENIKE